MTRRTADEIVWLRKLRKAPEPWWGERQRLTTYCPRCAKRYTHAKPGWVTCLECEINPRWTTVTEAEFIVRAREAFPGAYEPVRSIETAPSGREGGSQLSFEGDQAA
jgi:hypothetical protein